MRLPQRPWPAGRFALVLALIGLAAPSCRVPPSASSLRAIGQEYTGSLFVSLEHPVAGQPGLYDLIFSASSAFTGLDICAGAGACTSAAAQPAMLIHTNGSTNFFRLPHPTPLAPGSQLTLAATGDSGDNATESRTIAFEASPADGEPAAATPAIPGGVVPVRTLTGPLRIMQLGDSITEFLLDPQCPQGYRYEFWKQLIDAGLDFKMVGTHAPTRESGQTQPPYKGKTFDDACNCWGGWTTEHILSGRQTGAGAGRGNLDAWLQQDTADVVLIHLGTNDAWTGRPTAEVIANLGKIIDKIQAKLPLAVIYLAKIIPFGSPLAATVGATVPAYNAAMDALALQKSRGQSRVVIVDQYTGYDADKDNACDTQFKVHPGLSGARKMGKKWVEALQADFHKQ